MARALEPGVSSGPELSASLLLGAHDDGSPGLFAEASGLVADGVKTALYTAISEPVQGVAQICDKAAGTHTRETLMKGLDYFGIGQLHQAETALGQHVQMLGSAVGMMLPYLLIHRSVSNKAAQIFGSKAVSVTSDLRLLQKGEFGLAAAREASLAFASGFTYNALLRPSNDKEGSQINEFVQERFLNGIAGGTTMAALTASSLGLARLGQSALVPWRLAKVMLTNPVSLGVLSSVPSGLASAEVDALRHGNLLTNAHDVGQSIYQTAFIGLALGGFQQLESGRATASPAIPVDEAETFRNGQIVFMETPMEKARRLQLADDSASNFEQSKELLFAQIRADDGSLLDSVIRPYDGDLRSNLRIYRAAVSHRVNQTVKEMSGFDSPSLTLVLRDNVTHPKFGKDYQVEGTVTGPVMVQRFGGRQFGMQLKEWASENAGLSKSDEPPPGAVAKLLDDHPQVRELVARAVFDNMYKGNIDLVEFSQQTIAEGKEGVTLKFSDRLHLLNIDNKNDYTDREITSWGFGSQFGLTLEIAKWFEGKKLSDVSPQLQKDAQGILRVYSSQAGRQRLMADGLSVKEIDAAQKRLTSLVNDGFPRHLGETNYYSDQAQTQLSASLTNAYDDEAKKVSIYLSGRDVDLVMKRTSDGKMHLEKQTAAVGQPTDDEHKAG